MSNEFAVKKLIGERFLGDTCKLDVEEKFLYVHLVKAKGFDSSHGSPKVKFRIGNLRRSTECRDVWNRVFAFFQDEIHSFSVLELKLIQDHQSIGRCCINLTEIPKNIPGNCKVAPIWMRLQNRNDEWVDKWILLAVYTGDECNDERFHWDARRENGAMAMRDMIRSDLYFTPKLWYLRVNVIQAFNLPASSIYPQYYVRASLGNQTMISKRSPSRNPEWNEDLMFVTAEPFEEPLIISVDELVPSSSPPYTVVGRCVIPWKDFHTRSKKEKVDEFYHNLETGHSNSLSTICMRACLEGGYCVQHEAAKYSSHFKATDSKLWKSEIGKLELVMLKATGLMPKMTPICQQTTDAFCVAKYGQKLVRSRTIENTCAPIWNELSTWDFFDPYTVLTVGVVDSRNEHEAGARVSRVGKVRIRLSTLRTGQVYTHSYPLLVIDPCGVKKMGEIHLAVRFTCSSWLKLIHTYSQPLLPEMHRICPFGFAVSEYLRCRAADIVSKHLAGSEPPLNKDVVDYIFDLDSHSWSTRRSKINNARIVGILSGLYNFWDGIFKWKSTPKTLFAGFCIMVCIFFPNMALAFLPLIVFFTGLFLYFRSSDLTSHIDISFSRGDEGEIDFYEFDAYPSSGRSDGLSVRYDRLRRLAGVTQTAFGNVSSLMEKLFFLFSWRDQRATALFLVFCLVAGLILVLLWFVSRYIYDIPFFQVLEVVALLYVMRPPRFSRLKVLPWIINFLLRLPTRDDYLL